MPPSPHLQACDRRSRSPERRHVGARALDTAAASERCAAGEHEEEGGLGEEEEAVSSSPPFGLVSPSGDEGEGGGCGGPCSESAAPSALEQPEIAPVYLVICWCCGRRLEGGEGDPVELLRNLVVPLQGLKVAALLVPRGDVLAQAAAADLAVALATAARPGQGLPLQQDEPRIEGLPSSMEKVSRSASEGACPAEHFFPLLQEVYAKYCVGLEESCMLIFGEAKEGPVALRALGRWFLGKEPADGIGDLMGKTAGEEQTTWRLLWAAVDVAQFRLAGCSPELRFLRRPT